MNQTECGFINTSTVCEGSVPSNMCDDGDMSMRKISARAPVTLREATERLKKISYESISEAKAIYRKLEGDKACETAQNVAQSNNTYRSALDRIGDDNAELLTVLSRINDLI